MVITIYMFIRKNAEKYPVDLDFFYTGTARQKRNRPTIAEPLRGSGSYRNRLYNSGTATRFGGADAARQKRNRYAVRVRIATGYTIAEPLRGSGRC